jgi:hypothetical protein
MFFLAPMFQAHIDQVEYEEQKAKPLSRDPPTLRISRFKVKKSRNAQNQMHYTLV